MSRQFDVHTVISENLGREFGTSEYRQGLPKMLHPSVSNDLLFHR